MSAQSPRNTKHCRTIWELHMGMALMNYVPQVKILKPDQHNPHQQNSCTITERRQEHQHCVAAEIILNTQQWVMTWRNDGQGLAQCIVVEFLLFKSQPSLPPSANFARHTQMQCLQLLKLLWSKQFVQRIGNCSVLSIMVSPKQYMFHLL